MSNATIAQAKALFQALESHAQKLGIFRQVGTHEPVNMPPESPSCAILMGPIRADPGTSGLATTSLRATFLIRVYSTLQQNPSALDSVDPNVLGAVWVLLAEYTGAFSLANVAGVRNIDVHGVSAQPAYVTDFDGKPFRLMDITLPVIINDLWAESP